MLLIFFVVFGHLLESWIDTSATAATMYKGIYLFTMPMFAFLSGLFLKDGKGCLAQLKRTLPLYIGLQLLAVIFGSGTVLPWKPYWHLWYLLSNSFWLVFAWVWFRFLKGRFGLFVLLGSVVAGCLIGCVPSAGRTMSVSRTFVFFPYFFAGVLINPGFSWKKLRVWGLGTLACVVVLFILFAQKVSYDFLYHADSYENIPLGILLRLGLYFVAAAIGLFLLSFMPGKRFFFTGAAVDTMPVYILHAPLVLWLQEKSIPYGVYPLITAAFIALICFLFHWKRTKHEIISTPQGTNSEPLLKVRANAVRPYGN